jgi:hypothetical protein
VNDPIKHHYSPQMYLRSWCGQNGKLFRYHRPYRRTTVSSLGPEYTGFEEYLYSVGSDDPQKIEKGFFSPLDNSAAPVVRRLTDLGPGLAIIKPNDLDDAERTAWTFFIQSLHLRGPHSLAEIKTVFNQTVADNLERKYGEEYRESRRPGDPETIYDFAMMNEPALFGDAHKYLLTELIAHKEMGNYIINMDWAVLEISDFKHPFLTCDRPLIMPHGLLHPACLLGVPISPKHLFVAANTVAQLETLRRQPVNDTVRNANNLVVRMAVQNVYANTDDRREFVDKRLRRDNEPPLAGLVMGPDLR